VEIPGGAGESPYRVGALLHDVNQPGAEELTASWLKENLKHLKLDGVVEMAETPDYGDVRSIAASADGSVPLASRLANGLAALWRTARKPASRNAVRLKLDGEAVPLGARSARVQVRRMGVVDSMALAKSILDKNRPVHAALVQSLRSSMGVIPFVGAGMSAAFNFPQWGDLLRQLASPGQTNSVKEPDVERGDSFQLRAEGCRPVMGAEVPVPSHRPR